MREAHTLRLERLSLEARARDIGRVEAKILSDVEFMLRDGSEVEPGDYEAAIEPGGVFPKWKEAYLADMEEEAVQRVIANTPAKEKIIIRVREEDQ